MSFSRIFHCERQHSVGAFFKLQVSKRWPHVWSLQGLTHHDSWRLNITLLFANKNQKIPTNHTHITTCSNYTANLSHVKNNTDMAL